MSIKLTKRKGFNFFRSYYDVYNELETNEDKVAFIDALLDRQFLGVKPTNLKGMAKFAYISQTNSIDSQVKGYEDKTKINLTPKDTPTDTPTEGGYYTPTEQEKEKEKEKEITTTEIIAFVDAVNICLFDEQWKEDVERLFKIDRNKVQYALQEFKLHCGTTGENKPKSLNQFKKHFTNWVRVKKQYQVKTENKDRL
jgi:hypothetical protein